MEMIVGKRWLSGMQLLDSLTLDQIPLTMVSVVQSSIENSWLRFVNGLVVVGPGAHFVCLLVTFLKKKKLIIRTLLGIKETLQMVLLGLVIIFCVGVFGDLLLRLEGLETAFNQQNVEEITQSIPKGLILIFAGVIGPISEEGIFRVGVQVFFKPVSKIDIPVSPILLALVYTPVGIGSFVIYWGMDLALGWVYLRTGRFEATVLTHFIWNILGILMLQDRIYRSQASFAYKFGQSNRNDRNARKPGLNKPILYST